jgi:hypothetical protein
MVESLRLRVDFWIGVRVLKRGVLGVRVTDDLFGVDLVILAVVVVVGALGVGVGVGVVGIKGLVSMLDVVESVWSLLVSGVLASL